MRHYCSVSVRGGVRDLAVRDSAEGAQICLSRGHAPVDSVPLAGDGSFELTIPDMVEGVYHVTVFAAGREALRRRMVIVADHAEDIGSIALPRAEHPAGVRGLLWAAEADHPLTSGRVRLEQGGVIVGETVPGEDGAFSIEMSCRRPIPPGEYAVVAESSGYQTARIPVTVVDEITAYSVGRTELQRAKVSP